MPEASRAIFARSIASALSEQRRLFITSEGRQPET
jgi:hypothetical protein